MNIDDRFGQFGPRAVDAGLGAVFTFPLNHEDLRLGALDLYRDTPGPLSTAMATAQTLADVAAAYLINAQARSDLQAASDQSRDAALHDALTGLPNRVLLLERLETLPLEVLKIDQTFTAKLTTAPGTQTIVTSIVQLAHGLGMTVVAEGVETPEQHRELAEMGSDGCQGFYSRGPCARARTTPSFRIRAMPGCSSSPRPR